MSSFSFSKEILQDGNVLYIIDIQTIDHTLKDCLDKWFVKVCEGNRGIDLETVKTRVKQFLETKTGSTIEMGAIAEFFLHVFLNEQGYEPQFLYTNLEEGSIKKGFDGYYFYSGDEWILESKSGLNTTAGISHSSKIKESYDDLKAKLAGDGTNNPWENAYKHASMLTVGADTNVRQNIDRLSKLYTKGVFQKIDDTNIIPGATIFLTGTWTPSDHNAIKSEISELIKTITYKKILVLCVTKAALQLFLDYLNK